MAKSIQIAVVRIQDMHGKINSQGWPNFVNQVTVPHLPHTRSFAVKCRQKSVSVFGQM